jgi:hypothetical protein
MLCEIARNLDEQQLETIRTLEQDLGVLIVAFSCRELEPAREERLRQIMAELGPVLQAEPVEPDDAALDRLRETEAALGLSLIAVRR